MDPLPRRPSDVDREKSDLAQRAYRFMDSSFTPVPAHLVPSFRLWHYPVAGPHISWTVFQQDASDPIVAAPRLRRLMWDRDSDFERLELDVRRRVKIDPTLLVVELELESRPLSALLHKVSDLPMAINLLSRPYLSDERLEFGLDGFDIDGNDGRPIVRIEWGEQAHRDLRPLAAWANEVRGWLREVCPP